jgi:tetratricopeptide (TPR) repeat protein
MLVPLFLLATAPALEPPVERAAALVARGDALYERRAAGAQGAVAATGPIDLAIQSYREAMRLDRTSLEARAGLMRAIFFRGGFCDTPPDQQIRIFEEGKQVADETVRQIERALGPTRGKARIEALRRVPMVTRIYFWAAVSWGQWSVDHKLAAAWQGAAVRIRDLAQTVVDLDPTVDQGSAYLILGRLHAECPRIPMLTRWISRTQGIASLRRALELGPDNTPNMFFLADALLNYEPSEAEEARRLLERCAASTPRPEYAVEDAHYAEMARDRLQSLQ